MTSSWGRGESRSPTRHASSRGSSIRDRHPDSYEQAEVEQLAAAAGVPVVNGLTNFLHPCQIYADAFTAAERWAGPDGDLAAALQGPEDRIPRGHEVQHGQFPSDSRGRPFRHMKISLAGPADHAPGPERSGRCSRDRGCRPGSTSRRDPREAVAGADIVYTDVWTSMGQEAEAKDRSARMRPYAVTAPLFAGAKPDALFMHCLPAHPGEEVRQAVLDNPRSIIFDEAENRLHVQKAILAVLSEGRGK